MMATTIIALALALSSSPDLGKAEGRCRTHESGPAFLVTVHGLKDRRGLLKLELYPANDADFLQDDNLLLNAGKAFARVEAPVPTAGPVQLCIRAPSPGIYALGLLHDRDGNRKFGFSVDGIGFPGDPPIRFGKPSAAAASATVGGRPTRLAITLNYRRGLFSFGPLEK